MLDANLRLQLPRLFAGVSLLYFFSFLWVAMNRVTAPFELEWMEGGMVAHALRLREGLPIYAEPSLDFVPFFYTPGYPVFLFALERFGLSEISLSSARTVSLMATLLTMIIIYKLM